MNFQPTKKLIKQLGSVQNMDTFSRNDDLYWPKEIADYLLDKHGISPSVNDSIIGGKMTVPVIQHDDSVDADLSVVWFPKVNGDIVFVHGEKCRQLIVKDGGLVVFDHRLPHSISANANRGAYRTGTYYYMAQGFDKVFKEEI